MSQTIKLGIAAAATVVVLVLFWLLVNGIGGGPKDAAEGFFASIPSKGAQAAYATTSPAFQRATPLDTFVASAQASQLGSYQSSSWKKSDAKQGAAADVTELAGVINLKGGGAIPASIGLVKGQDGWSVLSLNLPAGGLFGVQASPTASASNETADGGATGPQANMGGSAPSPATAAPLENQVSSSSTQPIDQASNASSSPIVVTSGHVARICGQDIMRHGQVETLDVHCLQGLTATPGAAAQCIAVINGRRQGVGATLNRYNAVSGASDVSCHPER